MGGNDELTILVHRVDDAGNQVGEALADTGAGFEQQRAILGDRGAHGARHLLLLRAVFQFQDVAQRPGFREDVADKNRQARRLGAAFFRNDVPPALGGPSEPPPLPPQ